MIRSRALVVGLLIGAILALPGCASILTPGAERPVKVNSYPQGADVYVEGERVGTTPATIKVKRTQRHLVRVQHPDYEPYNEELRPGFNGIFLVNIAFPGVIGILVDLANGAHLQPTPGKLDVFLLPPGGDYEDNDQRFEAMRTWNTQKPDADENVRGDAQ